MVGPHYFDGSGLTTAALRGGRFRAARSLDDRVDAAVAAVRATPRSLVYLYWGEVDKVGHVHGCQSWQWGDEVESVDAALRQLAARVPDDTSIVVTADHGMVDVPFHDRIDLVHEPGLMAGVRHLGGEPRNLQLYTEPGATARRRGRVGGAARRPRPHPQPRAARRRGLVRPGATRGRGPHR